MDPKSEQFKITFQKRNESKGFKYFWTEKAVLDFLGNRPDGAIVIKLEQYDRETNTFQPIK